MIPRDAGTEVFEKRGPSKGKRMYPGGMARQAVGAQERPHENQVICFPGGSHSLPGKSLCFQALVLLYILT